MTESDLFLKLIFGLKLCTDVCLGKVGQLFINIYL